MFRAGFAIGGFGLVVFGGQLSVPVASGFLTRLKKLTQREPKAACRKLSAKSSP